VIKVAVNFVIVLAAVSLIARPDVARAGRGGGGHGGGGHGGGSHSGHGHDHHHGYGAAFVGGALFYPWPYSYNFYPIWEDEQQQGPVMYVEQFPGTPTPDTKDWIYCPAKAVSFPGVTECPGGWQRVVTPEQATSHAPAP
jgi:hypothetical protein